MTMGVENKIPEGWTVRTLGEVCENISRRFNFKEKEDVVFVNTGDVSNGKFLHHNRVSKEGLPGQAKKAVEYGDILYSEIRPANKRFALVDFDSKNYVVSTKFMVLKKNDQIDLDFLYVFLTSNKTIAAFQAHAEARSGTFPQITFDTISYDEILMPPLPEQNAIARVLTTFDDKIELLQAQNKTLETMAQTIFKEWFGKYQIGDDLPEGWRVGKLGEIASLKSGFAFKSKDFVEEGNMKALKIKDLKGDGRVSLHQLSSVSKDVTASSRVQYFKLEQGDIVIAMSGNTTGKIGVIPPHSEEVYLNQRVGKFFMIKEELNSFLYAFLMSGNYEEKILSMGYGSAQPNISPSQIESIDMIYPNEVKLLSFLNISKPIFGKVLYNNDQIQSLTKTRDTLLPKLMSGQVRVKNIKQTADA